jgi:hypothetical protein
MRLIVLTGLVVVEKSQLANDLADYYSAQNLSVTVIDNIARIPIENLSVPIVRLVDITADSVLADTIAQHKSDVLILAASEQIHPDQLFVTLDNLSGELEAIEITVLALIDLRTCDCFPNVRERLETYADTVIMLPYQLKDVLQEVGAK